MEGVWTALWNANRNAGSQFIYLDLLLVHTPPIVVTAHHSEIVATSALRDDTKTILH